MSKEELIEQLNSLSDDSDVEGNHIEADELLIAYINDEDVKQAFESISKWYSWPFIFVGENISHIY